MQTNSKQNLTQQNMTEFNRLAHRLQCNVIKMLLEDKDFQANVGRRIDGRYLGFEENTATDRLLNLAKEICESYACVDYDMLKLAICTKVSNGTEYEQCLAILSNIQATTLSEDARKYTKDWVYNTLTYKATEKLAKALDALLRLGTGAGLDNDVKRLYEEWREATVLETPAPVQMTGSDEEIAGLLNI